MIIQDNKPHYTIEEIRNYLEKQDSLGDIHYFLTDENIQKAQIEEELLEDEDL